MAHKVIFTWPEIDGRIISLIKKQKEASKRINDGTTQTGPNAPDSNPHTSPEGVIVIQEGNPNNLSIKTDILEDIDFEMGSEFGSINDMLPGFIETLGRVSNLLSGASPELLNVFKVPTWTSTLPLKFNLAPIFRTRTNAITDVLIPALSLSSLTILKQAYDENTLQPTSGLLTPGVFLGNVGAALNSRNGNEEQNPQTSSSPAPNTEEQMQKATDDAANKRLKKLKNVSSFISIEIPGVVNLAQCLLLSCKPKFSKQKTESGASAWAMLEMQIQTLLPASTREVFSGLNELLNNFGTSNLSGTQPQTAQGRLFT